MKTKAKITAGCLSFRFSLISLNNLKTLFIGQLFQTSTWTVFISNDFIFFYPRSGCCHVILFVARQGGNRTVVAPPTNWCHRITMNYSLRLTSNMKSWSMQYHTNQVYVVMTYASLKRSL